MNYWILIVLLSLGVLAEGAITTLPLTLSLLLILYILKKEPVIFFWAFLAGVLLDILLVRSISLSSIFFMVFLFMVFLYERKFETETFAFVFFASFVGSFLYLFFFGQGVILQQSIASSLLSVILFYAAGKKWTTLIWFPLEEA